MAQAIGDHPEMEPCARCLPTVVDSRGDPVGGLNDAIGTGGFAMLKGIERQSRGLIFNRTTSENIWSHPHIQQLPQ